jgi:hypothetical protein
MAYYTVAHLLQGGGMNYAGKPGLGGPCRLQAVTPDVMTHQAWDYVFLLSDACPAAQGPVRDALDSMRREFAYWYPVDLRVSGKDLIQNHLTMALYNHAAVWVGFLPGSPSCAHAPPPRPRNVQDAKPELWPRSFFTNGTSSAAPACLLHDPPPTGPVVSRRLAEKHGRELAPAHFPGSLASPPLQSEYRPAAVS